MQKNKKSDCQKPLALFLPCLWFDSEEINTTDIHPYIIHIGKHLISTHSCPSDRVGTQHAWSLTWFFTLFISISFFLKKDWDIETLTPRQRNWATYALLKVHLPKQGQHQSFFKVPLSTHIRCSGINPLVLGHWFRGSHLGDERIRGTAVLQASFVQDFRWLRVAASLPRMWISHIASRSPRLNGPEPQTLYVLVHSISDSGPHLWRPLFQPGEPVVFLVFSGLDSSGAARKSVLSPSLSQDTQKSHTETETPIMLLIGSPIVYQACLVTANKLAFERPKATSYDYSVTTPWLPKDLDLWFKMMYFNTSFVAFSMDSRRCSSTGFAAPMTEVCGLRRASQSSLKTDKGMHTIHMVYLVHGPLWSTPHGVYVFIYIIYVHIYRN